MAIASPLNLLFYYPPPISKTQNSTKKLRVHFVRTASIKYFCMIQNRGEKSEPQKHDDQGSVAHTEI